MESSSSTYQPTEVEKQLIEKHLGKEKVIVDPNFKGNHILKET